MSRETAAVLRAEAANSRSASRIDELVGRSVEARRKFFGMTQVELAKLIGVAPQQLQKYESAANRISAGRLYLIAEALGCAPGDFFPGPNP